MANEYLYGAYGHIADTVAQNAVQTGATPVYIGTAPVNLIRGYASAGIINEPIKLNNMIDAQKKLGYAADWGTYTLCEVMSAHFDNANGNIGPIYVINVLDPSEGRHRKSKATTKTLSFAGGRAEFASADIILDTLTVAKSGTDSGNYVEGVDYSVDYNYTKGTVIIGSLNEDARLTGQLTATYFEVDDSALEDTDIIGGVTSAGVYSGLSSLSLLYPEQFAVCNLIAAPGWSHIPTVYSAMVNASQNINGHWDAFVLADLPLVDSSAQAVDTIAKAITWKAANGYNSERSKVCWPQAVDTFGKVHHLSTLAAVELMRADAAHSGVPMETCGNKAVPVIKQYFGANSTNQGFDQQTGKELTQKGITTVVAWAGEWVLWGDHTAAYTFGADVDPRAIFDVSMRMLMHITNSFQREWSPAI
ncbi:MAG: phage tail sheath family protein, partial [Candidatus Spyradocola sp.]